MSSSITPTFGEIFRYNEGLYVFLAQNEEFIYTAKILDPDTSLKLKKLDEKRAKNPTAYKTDGHKLFSFVTLTTKDFINQLAHLADPPYDNEKMPYFDCIGCSVNQKDQDALREEILREGSFVDRGLKKIFKGVELE